MGRLRNSANQKAEMSLKLEIIKYTRCWRQRRSGNNQWEGDKWEVKKFSQSEG
jgi:hypothetical protein